MKKKSANISNPQVGHPMSSAKQPSNLVRTDAYDIGGLLVSLREVIKTARAAYGRHMRAFYTLFPNWNALRSELSWIQTSYLRKSAESVDKYSKDDPQIRADSSPGGQI